MSDTKARLVDASARLLQHQGLAGTGIKQILNDAQAPFSCLYHYFPGGKEELAAAAICQSGQSYLRLVEAVWDGQPDLASSVDAMFSGAASALAASDYADACPIATVALEVASTNDGLRQIVANIFEDWTSAAVGRLEGAGLAPESARTAALALIGLLEGAFILCQSMRTIEPMMAARLAAVTLIASLS
jgi:AcrR family transcriptional regulator